MIQGDFDSIALSAGQDLSVSGAQYKAVTVGGTIAANPAEAIGLVQNKPESGESLTVAYRGHMKGYAAAAITAGARLTVTTSGFLTTVASGGGVALGKCITAASSGDLFDFIGDFSVGNNLT